MGARKKLNVAVVNGTLIVAAGLGLVTQSWIVFLAAAAIGVGCSLHSGDIRLKGRRD
ncbi:MAG: hypothetical protein AB7I37_27345 [Pirellulales bacterium]